MLGLCFSINEQIRFPNVYALTGDPHIEGESELIKKVGFKAIYKELNK